MPITPSRGGGKADEENLAALLLLVAAQQQDGNSVQSVEALVERWREMKRALTEK